MTGSLTVNVEPLPTTLSTPTLPLWASTIQRTIESPRPEPPGLAARERLAAVEPLEDERQIRLGDADAGVRDREPRFARRGGDGHPDLPARLRVAQAVLDQVVEDLLQPAAVGEHEDRNPRDVGRELQPAIGGRDRRGP